ncbi:hypothetical protein [Methylobacterium oryzihabitans]|uniref:Uncharacterized protein n=1 Tax=Methylobacterium oryzihabitans TaxID=2499852 RepID=A0A437PEL3_9HYPH|nr:hypothetical protein [Methylobacterium oryzihabitans]RVU20697.1 hypothetical protein EOE48_04955 [Methylobacterium oryzihabitans]
MPHPRKTRRAGRARRHPRLRRAAAPPCGGVVHVVDILDLFVEMPTRGANDNAPGGRRSRPRPTLAALAGGRGAPFESRPPWFVTACPAGV